MTEGKFSIETPLVEVLLLDHARWLIDGQGRILSSIEARAGALIGWGAAQVTLNVGALALITDIAGGWAKVGAVLLAAAALAVTVGVAWVLNGVIRTKSMPAPSPLVTGTWRELEQGGFSHSSQEVARILAGSVLAPGQSSGAQPVVEGMFRAVTKRARALSRGVIGISVAVALDALAAISLTVAVFQQ